MNDNLNMDSSAIDTFNEVLADMEKQRMRRNRIAYLIFVLFLSIMSGNIASAQEQEVVGHAPAGPASWDRYGLSFNIPDDADIKVSDDTRLNLCTYDLCIDINVIDRRQLSDEEIGQLVITSIEQTDIDLSLMTGVPIDNELLQGGFIHTSLDNTNEETTIVAAFENIKAFNAFIVVIQAAPGKSEKAIDVLNSFTLSNPE